MNLKACEGGEGCVSSVHTRGEDEMPCDTGQSRDICGGSGVEKHTTVKLRDQNQWRSLGFQITGLLLSRRAATLARACPFVVGQEWSSWTFKNVEARLVDTAKFGLELPVFSALAFLRTATDREKMPDDRGTHDDSVMTMD